MASIIGPSGFVLMMQITGLLPFTLPPLVVPETLPPYLRVYFSRTYEINLWGFLTLTQPFESVKISSFLDRFANPSVGQATWPH